MITPDALDIPDLPNPLTVTYLHTDFAPPQRAYFGDPNLSPHPLYVLDADAWRRSGRPYKFTVDWMGAFHR